MKEKKHEELTELNTNENELTEQETEQDESSNSGKLPPNAVDVRGRWWLRYVITAAVLAVFVVLVAWARGAFTTTNQRELLGNLCDAFAIPGILAICFGLLIVASNGGTFDMLAYGFRTLFRTLKKDPLDRKYGNFYEYRKAKQAKKRTFWYLVIVGGVYTLIAAALLLAWYYAA